MRTPPRAKYLGLAIGLVGFLGASAASAMPANGIAITSGQPGVVITSAQPAEEVGPLLQVGWRCGLGWHWSYRWRRCVRNR